jgi:hypothetical protein
MAMPVRLLLVERESRCVHVNGYAVRCDRWFVKGLTGACQSAHIVGLYGCASGGAVSRGAPVRAGALSPPRPLSPHGQGV